MNESQFFLHKHPQHYDVDSKGMNRRNTEKVLFLAILSRKGGTAWNPIYS